MIVFYSICSVTFKKHTSWNSIFSFWTVFLGSGCFRETALGSRPQGGGGLTGPESSRGWQGGQKAGGPGALSQWASLPTG